MSQQHTPPKDLQSTSPHKKTCTYIPLLDNSYLSLIDDGLHKGAQSHCLNSLLPEWKNMHFINFCMGKTLESWHTTIIIKSDLFFSFTKPSLAFHFFISISLFLSYFYHTSYHVHFKDRIFYSLFVKDCRLAIRSS